MHLIKKKNLLYHYPYVFDSTNTVQDKHIIRLIQKRNFPENVFTPSFMFSPMNNNRLNKKIVCIFQTFPHCFMKHKKKTLYLLKISHILPTLRSNTKNSVLSNVYIVVVCRCIFNLPGFSLFVMFRR